MAHLVEVGVEGEVLTGLQAQHDGCLPTSCTNLSLRDTSEGAAIEAFVESTESKNTTPMAESDRGVRRYTYRKGKALAFSSLFSHSTEPGRSQSASRPHVYLCFTFGTDKMEHWPSIYESCSYQTRVLASPDGRLVAGQRGQQHA